MTAMPLLSSELHFAVLTSKLCCIKAQLCMIVPSHCNSLKDALLFRVNLDSRSRSEGKAPFEAAKLQPVMYQCSFARLWEIQGKDDRPMKPTLAFASPT